ncbi:unnamed protein product [Zymoseptoria tritici ST99CH_1A5]|uniref:Uncharacterized protein n=1 Tax=Zymoseptoria tritici ST99CH_1A5 TaxID=1276529 RepID=A0A1Y6LTN7_ZYMTR|nr:unnamed protein product [Zymoseptoria tritici ST99CH_1A5]
MTSSHRLDPISHPPPRTSPPPQPIPSSQPIPHAWTQHPHPYIRTAHPDAIVNSFTPLSIPATLNAHYNPQSSTSRTSQAANGTADPNAGAAPPVPTTAAAALRPPVQLTPAQRQSRRCFCCWIWCWTGFAWLLAALGYLAWWYWPGGGRGKD